MSSSATQVGTTTDHIIQGGIEGFDRLKVLSRVMHPATSAFFERVGVGPGMRCLDAWSGSGDVTFELARRVGTTGHVVGVDLDDVKLELARREANVAATRHVEFRHADVTTLVGGREFDLVYARFLLTHVTDPAGLLSVLRSLVRPGGVILVEDIDFSGYFCYPDHPSHRRYVELYRLTAKDKGVDPNIGPRLPGLLAGAGLDRVHMNIVQPMSTAGEVKTIPALTMKLIEPAVLAEKHATPEEMDKIVSDLTAMAADSTTVMGLPRVVQAWAYRPQE